jgi:hypothetical protein
MTFPQKAFGCVPKNDYEWLSGFPESHFNLPD